MLSVNALLCKAGKRHLALSRWKRSNKATDYHGAREGKKRECAVQRKQPKTQVGRDCLNGNPARARRKKGPVPQRRWGRERQTVDGLRGREEEREVEKVV